MSYVLGWQYCECALLIADVVSGSGPYPKDHHFSGSDRVKHLVYFLYSLCLSQKDIPNTFTMPETAPNSERSAFSCALEKYIELFPKESKKFEFIQKLKDQQANGLELNRTGVIKELQRLGDGTEKNKAARATRNALNPVVKMLTQYTGMVDTMIQADPMPSALIWGSFKS